MDFARWLRRQDIHDHIDALYDETVWHYNSLRRLIMSDFQDLEAQVHAITQAVRDAADRVNAQIAQLQANHPDLAPDIAELHAALADLNQIGQGAVPAPPTPPPAPDSAPDVVVGPDGQPVGGAPGGTSGGTTDVGTTDAGTGTTATP